MGSYVWRYTIWCMTVTPRATPATKERHIEHLGAKVVPYDVDFDEVNVECARLAAGHVIGLCAAVRRPARDRWPGYRRDERADVISN